MTRRFQRQPPLQQGWTSSSLQSARPQPSKHPLPPPPFVVQQGYFSTKHSVSRNMPIRNIQSVRMFQYKIFSQQESMPAQNMQRVGLGYSSTQNIQSLELFQYKIFSQQKYASAKYSVGKDILVQTSAKYSVSRKICQYKICREQGYSSTQNIQSFELFQYKIFSQQEYASTKY